MRAFWILAGVACCVSAGAAPVQGNYIAAIVNESIITREAVRASTEKAMDLLWRTYRDRPEVLREKQMAVYDDALKSLIDRQLILQDFLESGGKFPESVIDDQINDRIRRNFGDRATLTRTLQAQGMTTEAYRLQLRDDIIVSFMSRQHITSGVLISPAKIERFYEEHLDEFKQGEEVRLRMIVLGQARGVTMEEILQLAIAVHSKIRGGASFAEMAGIYSDPQQTEEGDWGWIERTKLNKGLSDLAFSLEQGGISPVVGMGRTAEFYWIYEYGPKGELLKGRRYTSQDEFLEEVSFDPALALPPPVAPQDYYLMKVEDRRAARTRPLDEVREEIEKDLTARERERLRAKWIDRLRKKAFVQYF